MDGLAASSTAAMGSAAVEHLECSGGSGKCLKVLLRGAYKQGAGGSNRVF